MLSFICDVCAMGADIKDVGGLALITKKNWHKQCKGGSHCDCQHRVVKKTIV
jgi:hypothetical protein